jgi:hypothetical protein
MTARETALVRAADRPIKRHAQNVVACRIRGCGGCHDCRTSAAYLNQEIADACAKQKERRAAMEERW